MSTNEPSDAKTMADETNLTGHVATYSSLIAMLKWGGLAAFFLAAAVIWLLAR